MILPFVKPVPLIWFVRHSTRESSHSPLRLLLVILAFVILGAAGYVFSWGVHQVEWAFASEADVNPTVIITSDSSKHPQLPKLESADDIPGRFSFGARTLYTNFGRWSGTRGGYSSPGTPPIYWKTDGFRARMVLPGLPLRKHYSQRTWVAPSLRHVLLWASLYPLVVMSVCFVNLVWLPKIMPWINRDGLACPAVMRQGFSAINAGTCLFLIPVGLLWIVGSANPGNWLIDLPQMSRWAARALFFLMMFAPCWVAVRGIGFDRGGRIFPHRKLSRVVVVASHLFALVCLFGVSTVIDFWV